MRIRLSRSLKLPVAEKRGRRVGRPRVRNSCVRAYACLGILGTQSSSNKQERERERGNERRGDAEEGLSRLSLGERIGLCVMKVPRDADIDRSMRSNSPGAARIVLMAASILSRARNEESSQSEGAGVPIAARASSRRSSVNRFRPASFRCGERPTDRPAGRSVGRPRRAPAVVPPVKSG